MSKMILIIEDEESIQNIIKAFLEDAGYTVVLAADGLEGIEQFRANKPDLVLLDLMLPKEEQFQLDLHGIEAGLHHNKLTFWHALEFIRCHERPFHHL